MRPILPRSRAVQLVLVLLVFAAGIWVWSLQRGQESKQGPPPVSLGPGSLDPSRVVWISQGDSVVVERSQGSWTLVHPLRDRADEYLIAEVLRRARELKAGRVLPDAKESAFGLDPPRRRFRLEDESGRSWGLALGDSSPVRSGVYARVEGGRSPIVLIESFTVRRYFTASLDRLRNPVPAPLRDPPDSISVLTREWTLHAVRESREQWSAREPKGLALDPLRINRAVRLLREPSIVGFLPEARADPAALGLDPPRARWILHLGGRAESVSVGHPAPDQETVYCIPSGRTGVALLKSDFYRSLVDGWPGLADWHLITVPPESLVAVSFLGDLAGRGYQREGGAWLSNSGGKPVENQEAFERDAANLAGLSWLRHPLLDKRPAAPRAHLTLLLRSTARAETLLLSEPSPTDSIAWARSSRRPLWGAVNPLVHRLWRYRADHPNR